MLITFASTTKTNRTPHQSLVQNQRETVRLSKHSPPMKTKALCSTKTFRRVQTNQQHSATQKTFTHAFGISQRSMNTVAKHLRSQKQSMEKHTVTSPSQMPALRTIPF